MQGVPRVEQLPWACTLNYELRITNYELLIIRSKTESVEVIQSKYQSFLPYLNEAPEVKDLPAVELTNVTAQPEQASQVLTDDSLLSKQEIGDEAIAPAPEVKDLSAVELTNVTAQPEQASQVLTDDSSLSKQEIGEQPEQ